MKGGVFEKLGMERINRGNVLILKYPDIDMKLIFCEKKKKIGAITEKAPTSTLSTVLHFTKTALTLTLSPA